MAIRTDLSRLTIPSDSLRAFRRGGLIRVSVPAIWRVVVGDALESKAGTILGYASVVSVESGYVDVINPNNKGRPKTVRGVACLVKGYD